MFGIGITNQTNPIRAFLLLKSWFYAEEIPKFHLIDKIGRDLELEFSLACIFSLKDWYTILSIPILNQMQFRGTASIQNEST